MSPRPGEPPSDETPSLDELDPEALAQLERLVAAAERVRQRVEGRPRGAP